MRLEATDDVEVTVRLRRDVQHLHDAREECRDLQQPRGVRRQTGVEPGVGGGGGPDRLGSCLWKFVFSIVLTSFDFAWAFW